MELTFGQKTVGLTFNPSGSYEVTEMKQYYADIIDTLNKLREESLSTNVDGQFCKYLVMCSCGLVAESSI